MDTSSSLDQLPDEIIELILSRCPLESVLRFKSVSKSWHSIISSSRFSRIHRIQRSRLLEDQNMFFLWKEDDGKEVQWGRRNSNYGLHLIRLEEDEKFQTKSESLLLGYPASSSAEWLEPLCSCNGLILLRVNAKYMLWNPLIRKHIIIPDFNPNTHRKAFRCWSTPISHLYHDAMSDDYKIVFHYELRWYAVYSCKNRSWGKINDFPRLDWKECLCGIDGCIYGMRRDKSEIISFDVRDEKLHKFPLPEGVECLVEVKLEALSGRLCLYGFNDILRQRIQLWVMEENGSFDKSWRKLISMEKDEPICFMTPVYLTKKDNILLRGTVASFGKDKIVCNKDAHFIYNPHGNCTFKQIDDHFSWDHNFFFPYSENLDMPLIPSRRKRPQKERHVFKG